MSAPSASSTSAPAKTGINPRLGYAFAALNAIISGVAIYVNSNGVKLFADSTLYTSLKNAVVGVVLLVPLIFLARSRQELRRLTLKQWGLLLLVSLIGGSVAYALQFRGLQLSTPVTASLVDHTQFLYVALLAALFLRERFGPGIWLALVVLFVGLSFGIQVKAVRWDEGIYFLLSATILLALDFVLIKYLLGRGVSMLMVMFFKMSIGAGLLLGYEAATGHLGAVTTLNTTQWEYVLVTGIILLAFTLTSIAGLRHASATAVIAIGAGSPIITTLLVVLNSQTPLTSDKLFGLSLILVAVLLIFVLGQRHELRARARAQQETVATA